jgi:hypothetical protein
VIARLALCALVLALTGAAASAAPLPATEYRARAQAICAETERGILRLPPPTEGAQVAPYIDRLLPVLRRAVRRLDALDPPPALAGQHERFLRSGRLGIALFARMRARVRRGADPVAVVQASERPLARLDAQGNAAARALGLPACAREVTADPT